MFCVTKLWLSWIINLNVYWDKSMPFQIGLSYKKYWTCFRFFLKGFTFHSRVCNFGDLTFKHFYLYSSLMDIEWPINRMVTSSFFLIGYWIVTVQHQLIFAVTESTDELSFRIKRRLSITSYPYPEERNVKMKYKKISKYLPYPFDNLSFKHIWI